MQIECSLGSILQLNDIIRDRNESHNDKISHFKKVAEEKLIRNSMEKERTVQHRDVYNIRGEN